MWLTSHRLSALPVILHPADYDLWLDTDVRKAMVVMLTVSGVSSTSSSRLQLDTQMIAWGVGQVLLNAEINFSSLHRVVA